LNFPLSWTFIRTRLFVRDWEFGDGFTGPMLRFPFFAPPSANISKRWFCQEEKWMITSFFQPFTSSRVKIINLSVTLNIPGMFIFNEYEYSNRDTHIQWVWILYLLILRLLKWVTYTQKWYSIEFELNYWIQVMSALGTELIKGVINFTLKEFTWQRCFGTWSGSFQKNMFKHFYTRNKSD